MSKFIKLTDEERRERDREYNRRWKKTPAGRAHKKRYVEKWLSTPEGRAQRNQYESDRRKKNKLKVNARTAVYRAVRAGRIQKLPCERCGSTEVEAHHHDYEKRFDVIWLCRKHHDDLHQSLKIRHSHSPKKEQAA